MHKGTQFFNNIPRVHLTFPFVTSDNGHHQRRILTPMTMNWDPLWPTWCSWGWTRVVLLLNRYTSRAFRPLAHALDRQAYVANKVSNAVMRRWPISLQGNQELEGLAEADWL